MSNAAAATQSTTVQSLPLPAAVVHHTPSLTSLFTRMALRVVMTREYHPSTGHVTLTFACDPQSDTLSRDERAVVCEAKAMLIYLGFYVKEVGEMRLVLTGYYGMSVSPKQDVAVPAAPESGVGLTAEPTPAVEVLPAGCLTVPRETFAGHFVERWTKGKDAQARVRWLRAVGLSVTTCTRVDSRKLWNEPGADRVSVEVTEIAYILPRGAAPPAVPVYEQTKRAA